MFKLHLTSELKEAFISLTAKQMEGYRAGHAAPAPNPPLKKMVLHEKRCTGCGACAVMCPARAIAVSDNRKHRTVTITMSSCIYCGVCAAICPEQALEFEQGSDLPALARVIAAASPLGTTPITSPPGERILIPIESMRALRWTRLSRFVLAMMGKVRRKSRSRPSGPSSPTPWTWPGPG